MLKIVVLMLCLIQFISSQPTCQCFYIFEQQICERSKACLWNQGKCTANDNFQINQNNACTTYSLFECAQIDNCSYFESNCIQFTGCDIFPQSACHTSSNQCIFDGINCIQKNLCQNYYTQIACQNQNIDGGYCKWDSNKCQQIQSCSELPKLQSHDLCNQALQYCTVDDNGTCIQFMNDCTLYKIHQCYKTIDNKECFWDNNQQICLEKICQNAYYTTDQQCNTFLSICTTNGVNCIQRSTCNIIININGCIKDNQNQQCYWTGNQCILKNCLNIPYGQDCINYFQDLNCIQTINGLCKDRPQNCDQIDISQSCNFDKQGNECYWYNGNCVIKQCNSAPQFTNCLQFKQNNSCMNDINGYCIDLPQYCSQILNITNCYKDKLGGFCQYQFCTKAYCSKAPLQYILHNECEQWNQDCTIDLQNGGCINKLNQCQDYKNQEQCHSTLQRIECIYINGQCIEKQCQQAISCINFQDCQNWKKTCIQNKNNNGCIDWPLICEEFQSEIQCNIGLINGTYCQWNGLNCITQLNNQLCTNSQNNQLFNTHQKCNKWDNKCTVIQKVNGCTPRLNCQDYLTQHQCVIGINEQQCTWINGVCQNICYTYNTETSNLNDCQTHNQSCTINSFTAVCIQKTYCSVYQNQLDCRINHSDQPCKWDSVNKKCLDVVCEDNITALTESECTYYLNYQQCQLDGVGCITRPLSCDEIVNPILCNSTIPKCKSNYCYYTNGCCQEILANQCEQILDAQTDDECQKYNSDCVLNYVNGLGCMHMKKCSYIKSATLCASMAGLGHLSNGDQCIYSNGSCHSQNECDGFASICNTQSVASVKCQTGPGPMCAEKQCSGFTGVASDANCSAYQVWCYYNGTSCKSAQQCSDFNTSAKCVAGKTVYNQYCQWISGTCQIVACTSIASNCLFYNNKCTSGTSTCQNIVTCNQITSETDCYIAYNQSNLKCLWINFSCQDYFACNDISTTSFSEYQCTRYDLCRLSKTSNGCEYKNCNEYTQIEYCNILPQCIWSSGICNNKNECQFLMNSTDCLTNQYCIWNSTICQYQQCLSATTQLNCSNIKLQSGNKCLWFNNQCIEKYQCSYIKYPQFFEDCHNQHQNCVITYTFSDKSHYCITKYQNCSAVPTIYQCISDIYGNQCLWDSINSQCIYNQCSQYNPADNIYTNIRCQQFNSQCVANTTGTKCRTRLSSCNQYLTQSTCDYGLITSGAYCFWNSGTCINAQCSHFQLLSSPQISCQQFGNCSLIGGICINRLANCNLYLNQIDCNSSKDSSGNICVWINNQCIMKTCSNYPNNLFNNTDCNQWLSTCTVNQQESACITIVNCLSAPAELNTIQQCQDFISPDNNICTLAYSIGGCTNLPTDCTLASKTQCIKDQNNNKCYWSKQYAICKQLTCNNIDTTIITATDCEQILSNCTISSSGQGCTNKLNCISYGGSQCQLPDIKDNNDSKCTYGCQLVVCEDYQYQTDIQCNSILDGKCITNGFYCIKPIFCNDYTFEQQCEFQQDGQQCLWYNEKCMIRQCNLADNSYINHSLCQQFMNICTFSKQQNRCINIDICIKFDNQDSCQIDKYGNNCFWYNEQCYNSYCQNICGDGIIDINNEQCDDGNLIKFDGCYNCQYSCVIGCINCDQGICIECDSNQGYYINQNNQCITQCGDLIIQAQEQCEDGNNIQYDGCYNCQFQCHYACLTCLQGICQQCQQGWILSINDQCEQICGDGIVSLNEQCDDGNTDSMDGCSQDCIVENQWDCFNAPNQSSECTFVQPSKMILKMITTVPGVVQQASITFSKEMKLVKNISESIMNVSILSNDPSKYDIKQVSITAPNEDFQNIEYLITVEFKQSIELPKLHVVIDGSYFGDRQKQTPKQTDQTLTMLIAYVETKFQLGVSQNSQLVNRILLYILLAIGIISILTGNLDIFWNLLDLVQYQSYLKYINIQFSPNLNTYFQLFDAITLQPLLDFLHFQTIVNLFSNNETVIIPTTNKFEADNINAFYFYNFASSLLIFGTTFLTYYGNLSIVKLVTKQMFKVLDHFYILKFVQLGYRSLIKFLIYFFYSGVIRIFLTNAYDILFTVFLQLYYPQFDQPFKVFSLGVAFFSLCFMLNMIYFILSKQTSLTSFNDGLEVLSEDIKAGQGIWTRQYSSLLLLKKFSFMFILIFMQSAGQVQTIFISISHITFVLYLISQKPITNFKEYCKMIVVETGIGFATAIFILYDLPILSIDQKYNTGWLHIAIFTSILIFTVFVDITDQVRVLWVKMQKKCYGRVQHSEIILFENVTQNKRIRQEFANF